MVNKQLILNNLYVKHNIFILFVYYVSLFPPLNKKKICNVLSHNSDFFLAFVSLFPTILTFLLTTVSFFHNSVFSSQNCELISCNSDFTCNRIVSRIELSLELSIQ